MALMSAPLCSGPVIVSGDCGVWALGRAESSKHEQGRFAPSMLPSAGIIRIRFQGTVSARATGTPSRILPKLSKARLNFNHELDNPDFHRLLVRVQPQGYDHQAWPSASSPGGNGDEALQLFDGMLLVHDDGRHQIADGHQPNQFLV